VSSSSFLVDRRSQRRRYSRCRRVTNSVSLHDTIVVTRCVITLSVVSRHDTMCPSISLHSVSWNDTIDLCLDVVVVVPRRLCRSVLFHDTTRRSTLSTSIYVVDLCLDVVVPRRLCVPSLHDGDIVTLCVVPRHDRSVSCNDTITTRSSSSCNELSVSFHDHDTMYYKDDVQSRTETLSYHDTIYAVSLDT